MGLLWARWNFLFFAYCVTFVICLHEAFGKTASLEETVIQMGMEITALKEIVVAQNQKIGTHETIMEILMAKNDILEKKLSHLEELHELRENTEIRSESDRAIGRKNLVDQYSPVAIHKVNGESRELARDDHFEQPKEVTGIMSGIIDGKFKDYASYRANRQHRAIQHVAFSAYIDIPQEHVGSGVTINYNQVFTNDGNGYNHYTGIFTAPISGVYFFTLTVHAIQKMTTLRLLKDGVEVINIIAEASSTTPQHSMSSNSAILNVNAGEAIWVGTIYNTDIYFWSNTEYRADTFSGFLLFENQ